MASSLKIIEQMRSTMKTKLKPERKDRIWIRVPKEYACSFSTNLQRNHKIRRAISPEETGEANLKNHRVE